MPKKVYRFKTRPWKHQVKGLKRALRQGTYCLNMEMRTGKTKVAIDYIACQHLWKGADTVLVLTPKSVIGRWWLEFHTHLERHIRDALDIRVLNYEQVFGRERWEERKWKNKKGKKRRRTYYSSDPDWNERKGKIVGRGWEVIDNVELIKWARRAARRGRFILILDESHIISNPTASISTKTYKLARMTDMVLALTGTPFHKKPDGVFGQWKMLDSSVFGTSKRSFDAMYSIRGGYGNFQVLRWINLDHMAQKIAPKIYVVKEEDCWDIPRSMDEIVPVELEESYDTYTELARESIVQIRDEVIEAPLAITLALRLHQVTGGILRNDEGRPVRVGAEKQRAYGDLVEELEGAGRRKLVTIARYTPELAVCARVAMQRGFRVILFHGGVAKDDRDYRIACFEEWREPTIFISQVATGSMGIELSVARDEIFYSLTNNLVHYSQVRARIRGHKQRHNMTYYHLLANGTVDPLMYMALRNNLSLGETILRHPEMLKARFVRR